MIAQGIGCIFCFLFWYIQIAWAKLGLRIIFVCHNNSHTVFFLSRYGYRQHIHSYSLLLSSLLFSSLLSTVFLSNNNAIIPTSDTDHRSNLLACNTPTTKSPEVSTVILIHNGNYYASSHERIRCIVKKSLGIGGVGCQWTGIRTRVFEATSWSLLIAVSIAWIRLHFLTSITISYYKRWMCSAEETNWNEVEESNSKLKEIDIITQFRYSRKLLMLQSNAAPSFLLS